MVNSAEIIPVTAGEDDLGVLDAPAEPIGSDCDRSDRDNGTSALEEDLATDPSQGDFTDEEPGICWLWCLKKKRDQHCALVIIVAVLYFVATAMTMIPKKLLINERIAGDPEEPNSKSAFVDTTNVFVHSAMSFISGRYTSGMGDYIGRKPVLIVAAFMYIVSRVLYLSATKPSHFYVAAVTSGMFECFYFSSLAWVNDLYPNSAQRSKRVGLFTGLVGGIGFFIGVPTGAVLATRIHPTFPLKVSMSIAGVCILLLCTIPVDDTRGVKKSENGRKVRSFPEDPRNFAVNYFPISMGTWELIQQGQYRLDWLTNFLMHTSTATVNLIFVQYALAVLGFTAVQTAAAALAVGLALGLLSPGLLNRYHPVALGTYAMSIFCIGVLVLSIAGTGISIAPILGGIGVVICALGTPYVPVLHTNILNQYSSDQQGAVSGMLNQQNDLSLIPAYIMSLGFTMSVDRGDNQVIYWPGSTFAAAFVSGAIGILAHCYAYGDRAFTLMPRKSAFDVFDRVESDGSAVDDSAIEMISV